MSQFREVQIGPCRLICADCRDVLPTLQKVDAVVTDPPYPKEFIPIYESTWNAVDAALDENGVVFAMCGQAFLPDVVRSFPEKWNYIWTGCFDCSHMATAIWPRGVSAAWKPLFIYGKGNKTGFKHWKYDTISLGKSGYRAPKQFHQWGQGVYEFETILRRFDVTGVVCDPFMGSGTTGIACINVGNEFIGIEVDHKHFETAATRIQQAWDLKCSELPFEEPPKLVQRELVEVTE